MQLMKSLVVLVVTLGVLAPALAGAQPFGLDLFKRHDRSQPAAGPAPDDPLADEIEAGPPAPLDPMALARLDARAQRLVEHAPCAPETLPALDDAKRAAAAHFDAALAAFGDWRDAVADEEAEWQELAFQAQVRLERYRDSSSPKVGHLPKLPDDPAYVEARRLLDAVQAERQRREMLVGQTVDFVVQSIETAESTQAFYRAALRRADAAIAALSAEADLQEQFYVTVRYQVRAQCLPRFDSLPPSPGVRIWQRWRR